MKAKQKIKTTEIEIWDVWKVLGIIGLFIFAVFMNAVAIALLSLMSVHKHLLLLLGGTAVIVFMNILVASEISEELENARKTYRVVRA